MAVIGPYNSGCAQVELPILNRAPGGPLAVISPTNSEVGLTRSGVPPPDGYRGSPEVFYPIGTRHYVRLTSPESLYGAAIRHTQQAARPGPRLRDRRRQRLLEDHAFGPVPAGGAQARRPHRRSGDVRSAGTERRRARGPGRAIRCAGRTDRRTPLRGVFELLKAVRARLGNRAPIMVGYTFASIPTDELFDQVGPALRGVYVATLDVPRTVMPLTAAAAARRSRRRRGQPGVLETTQATELVLRAIAGSDGTRASVLARLRASKVRDGILGNFRFDRNGDMTPGWVPILRFTRPGQRQRDALRRRGLRPCRASSRRASWTDRAADGVPPAGPARGGRTAIARSRSGPGKQRSLFALLLLHANEIVSTDRLIDALWGATPPPTAAKTVQVYVSRLRKELGDGRLAHPPARIRPAGQPVGARPRAVRATASTRRGDPIPPAPPRRCSGRWTCGGGRHSPTSPTRRSRSPRSPGSRSCAGRRASSGSTPISPAGRDGD